MLGSLAKGGAGVDFVRCVKDVCEQVKKTMVHLQILQRRKRRKKKDNATFYLLRDGVVGGWGGVRMRGKQKVSL